ncbi:hypothetical protein CBR_g48690 [Chara braunii]|uniref:HMG box domain-containing protein n=1 Tax=Chara braunii TaxID=69332 RepID=A0A388K4F6_CHABU|nr:hypothetical protein CBR_g48690 [Chara braunii]|eukprot:GBG64942.1 hypothetical protein CBR_g48690 [Chara braunii]
MEAEQAKLEPAKVHPVLGFPSAAQIGEAAAAAVPPPSREQQLEIETVRHTETSRDQQQDVVPPCMQHGGANHLDQQHHHQQQHQQHVVPSFCFAPPPPPPPLSSPLGIPPAASPSSTSLPPPALGVSAAGVPPLPLALVPPQQSQQPAPPPSSLRIEDHHHLHHPHLSADVSSRSTGGGRVASGSDGAQDDFPASPDRVHGGDSDVPLQISVYPEPLASHDAVVADKGLFLDSLQKFHAACGTPLRIPNVAGKELDMHMLYSEVTSRGGLEQVIKDKKWRDITLPFNFPHTCTSASFTLRKCYIKLLHHFEQVYMFGARGKPVPPPASLPAPSKSPVPEAGNSITYAAPPEVEVKSRQRKRKPATTDASVDPASVIGHTVTGAIEAKFEFGYLVTVMVGAEKLKGVLYHVPVDESLSTAVPSSVGIGLSSGMPTMNGGAAGGKTPLHRRKRRKRDEIPKKDPNAPKPNKTGYNFFFGEWRPKLKEMHPEKSEKDISRMIGELWNKTTDEGKIPYQALGHQDKERYERELKDYRERMAVQMPHVVASGQQQQPQMSHRDHHHHLPPIVSGSLQLVPVMDQASVRSNYEAVENTCFGAPMEAGGSHMEGPNLELRPLLSDGAHVRELDGTNVVLSMAGDGHGSGGNGAAPGGGIEVQGRASMMDGHTTHVEDSHGGHMADMRMSMVEVQRAEGEDSTMGESCAFDVHRSAALTRELMATGVVNAQQLQGLTQQVSSPGLVLGQDAYGT